MQNDSGLPNDYIFILFVSGMSPKSSRALENIRKICDSQYKGNYELQVIDINTQKEKAVEYQIVGIPTLIKFCPGVKRTILGDLSDTEKVLRILET